MNTTYREGAFTKGNPVSRALLGLAADQAMPISEPITPGLVELAQRHGLVGALAAKTSDPLVRAVFARETARRKVLEKHLNRLLMLLHDTRVKATVLKGPAIASRYQIPEQRPFSDVDLLVPEHQVGQALDMFAEDPATVRVPAKRPKADKRDVLLQDESGVRFNVDLHWDLFSYSQLRGTADGATEAAWAEAQEQPDSALGPLWEIPDSYRIAFLGSHAVLDHRFRLILFRDFLELSRSGVDWLELARVATRWNLRSTTYLALWISKSALNAAVPDDFLSSLRPRSAPIAHFERALPRVDITRFDGHRPHSINLAAVLLNDSPWQRFSLLLRAPAAFPGWRRRVAHDSHRSHTPRTLILVSTDRRRGAEVFTERLRDGLTAKGWIVEAVSLRGSGEEPTADVEPLVARKDSSGTRFEWRVFAALRRRIRAFRPDVVVANGGATLRYAIAARFGMGYRLTYVGIGEPNYWIRSPFSKWLNRFMLRRTNQVLAVADATRAQLLELEPSLKGRIWTTHTGVPGTLFGIPIESAAGPLRVLMVGSLATEKEPTRALRVVSAVAGARLRYVGDGPLMGELEAESKRLGMGDRVEFAGSVTDVAPHLEWAHVLILTSLSEGLPGAILEAGAAGVPTVAVDVGGVREAVADGVSGFVTGRSDDQLIEALRSLDLDRERLAQMGEAARQHIHRYFKLEDVIRKYADALSHLTR